MDNPNIPNGEGQQKKVKIWLLILASAAAFAYVTIYVLAYYLIFGFTIAILARLLNLYLSWFPIIGVLPGATIYVFVEFFRHDAFVVNADPQTGKMPEPSALIRRAWKRSQLALALTLLLYLMARLLGQV